MKQEIVLTEFQSLLLKQLIDAYENDKHVELNLGRAMGKTYIWKLFEEYKAQHPKA